MWSKLSPIILHGWYLISVTTHTYSAYARCTGIDPNLNPAFEGSQSSVLRTYEDMPDLGKHRRLSDSFIRFRKIKSDLPVSRRPAASGKLSYARYINRTRPYFHCNKFPDIPYLYCNQPQAHWHVSLRQSARFR
jgi:hypothetical protein